MSQNRVLVGLPARLRDAKQELRRHELLVEAIKTLYSQRLILTDTVVLDHIGEILNLPKIEGDKPNRQDEALGEALRNNYPEQFGGPIA